MGLETILTTLLSSAIPPLLDILKTKVVGAQKPEQILGSMALNEKTAQFVPQFVESLQKLIETQSQFQKDLFNVDVVGQPSQFVVDLRALIRPVTVLVSLGVFAVSPFVEIPQYVQQACSMFIGFWFGSRFVEKWK